MKIFSNHEACPDFEIHVEDFSPLNSVARVKTFREADKKISVQKSKFASLDESQLYIVLRWCYHKHNISKHGDLSYKLADRRTIKDCISIGLRKLKILTTFVDNLACTHTPMNLERIQLVHRFLNK